MDEMQRREFVALVSIASANAAPLVFFSPEEALWVEALMSQIIPTDDTPGAKEANCLNFLDLQLTKALARFGASYRQGLKLFRKAHPDFLTLSFAEQTKRLEALGANPFFEMLVDHTMQGFYGSPIHGGNRNEVSWKMLGIEKYMGGGHWHGA
jgi:gluconate 2-dehydrogenase gamma chain